ncbi:hypothetical protein BDZ89DRAFT_1068361 [Hymenopellis radicata]|nr:hypothetical protein BDZ89DRAFT_1068361 [Hymenopellis radicata]
METTGSDQKPTDKQLKEQKAAFADVHKYMIDHGLPKFFDRMARSLITAQQSAVAADATSHASASSFHQSHMKLLHWDFGGSVENVSRWDVIKPAAITDTSDNLKVNRPGLRASTRNDASGGPTVVSMHHGLRDLNARLGKLSDFFRNPSKGFHVPRDWMPAKNAKADVATVAAADASEVKDLPDALLHTAMRHLSKLQKVFADQPKPLEGEDPEEGTLPAYPNGSVAFFRFAGAAKPEFRGPSSTIMNILSAPSFQDKLGSEMITERYIGPLVHGFFEIRDAPTKSNQILANALILLAAASRPKPDICAIATIRGLSELYEFVIGAAEAKVMIQESTTQVQLAAAFHPTLIMMVLLQLRITDDTVTSQVPLPDWYFLIGITYDRDGVIFYVHMPRFDRMANRWYFQSMLLDDTSKDVFRFKRDEDANEQLENRANLARKLLAMQRHMAYTGKRSSHTHYFPPVFHGLEARWQPQFPTAKK